MNAMNNVTDEMIAPVEAGVSDQTEFSAREAQRGSHLKYDDAVVLPDRLTAVCPLFSPVEEGVRRFHIEDGYVSSLDQYTIDAASGDLFVGFDELDDVPETEYVPVVLTFMDGSTATITAALSLYGGSRVPPLFYDPAEPSYAVENVYPADVGYAMLEDEAADSGVRSCEITDDFTEPAGWEFEVLEDGYIIAHPPADAEVGMTVDVPVCLGYWNGSVRYATATFRVISPEF